jgi:SNF family Na+-dependent transporter
MLRESWRNHEGFALVAMESGIGLASIVRFPYTEKTCFEWKIQ